MDGVVTEFGTTLLAHLFDADLDVDINAEKVMALTSSPIISFISSIPVTVIPALEFQSALERHATYPKTPRL